MYGLIQVTVESIKHIFNEAMEEVDTDYVKKLEKNVNENIKNLNKIIIIKFK